MQMNSKNKTILILSDSHQEIDKLMYILKRESYDIAVHLGDHFDSFDHNSERDVEKTCTFLKEWVVKDNFLTLFGNHDIQYFYINEKVYCSGYYDWKEPIIDKVFGDQKSFYADKFKWYVWIDNFFCSHAGLNIKHFPPYLKINKKNITDWMDGECRKADIALNSNQYHWFYRAGMARGGSARCGGLVWQDFDVEFEPIDGLAQCLGHSPHNQILPYHLDGTMNYEECKDLDIDCHLNQYLLISNGKLKIKSYKDL